MAALSTRLSRDDYKKAKELDELRKTGAAPPETDEDGKMINPHIPQYISASPWYLNNNRPGLKHQRMSAFGEKASFARLGEYYERGSTGNREGRKKVWGKDDCTNCGASTHKTKDCTERPRLKGAKLTKTNIAGDEVIQKFNLDFDGKRDRWNGYNPANYDGVISLYEKTEKERRVAKKKELDEKFRVKKEQKEQRRLEREARRLERHNAKKEEKQKKKEEKKKTTTIPTSAASTTNSSTEQGATATTAVPAGGENKYLSESDTDTGDTDTDTDTDTDNSDNEEEEEDNLDDAKDTRDEGTLVQTRADQNKFTTNRTTARNLRIREDTAKYLRNLNIHSAYYDPKTRSMRENPYPDKNPAELMYAGDNFMRKTGDATEIAKLQLFVWDAADRGKDAQQDVHMLANPSQAELLYEQFKQKKEALKAKRSEAVVAKYGGEEHMAAPPKELLLAQSETYVEYSEAGDVIKGQEAAIPKTKYLEDVFENNHTAVWGSYFKDGKWGYACCHGLLRSGYCTGSSGKAAAAVTFEPAPAKAAPVLSLTDARKAQKRNQTNGQVDEEELENYRKNKAHRLDI